jgi:hypothetical protein
MRILLLVDNYYPSTKSVAKMMRDLALELARLGHDVKVAAADDDLLQKVSITQEDGTTVLRVNAASPPACGAVVKSFSAPIPAT